MGYHLESAWVRDFSPDLLPMYHLYGCCVAEISYPMEAQKSFCLSLLLRLFSGTIFDWIDIEAQVSFIKSQNQSGFKPITPGLQASMLATAPPQPP